MPPEDLTENSGLGDEFDAPQASVEPRQSARDGRGSLLLAGLFIAGIAGVWLLSFRNGPGKAQAEQQTTAESTVDTALSSLMPSAGEKDRAMDIVKSFYYAAQQRQIPLERLRGNPFVFRPENRPVVAVQAASAPSPVDDDGARELCKAMAAAQSLRLQSVLVGTRASTAIVSNNLLSEGQIIQGWTVSQVFPREVHLTWKNHTYVLKLPD